MLVCLRRTFALSISRVSLLEKANGEWIKQDQSSKFLFLFFCPCTSKNIRGSQVKIAFENNYLLNYFLLSFFKTLSFLFLNSCLPILQSLLLHYVNANYRVCALWHICLVLRVDHLELDKKVLKETILGENYFFIYQDERFNLILCSILSRSGPT